MWMTDYIRYGFTERPDAPGIPVNACALCEAGFRRVSDRVGSQRLGIIPDKPCSRVFAERGEDAVDGRRFTAYVDGSPLIRKRDGEVRCFATATAAINAARKAAPRRWYP